MFKLKLRLFGINIAYDKLQVVFIAQFYEIYNAIS